MSSAVEVSLTPRKISFYHLCTDMARDLKLHKMSKSWLLKRKEVHQDHV